MHEVLASRLNLPAEHVVHVDAFDATPVKDPAGHVEQRVAAGASVKNPLAHTEHTEAPASEKEPGEHCAHTDTPATPANLPAAHAEHVDDPDATPVDVPTGHEAHEVAPVVLENLPLAHGEHGVPGTKANRPGAQILGTIDTYADATLVVALRYVALHVSVALPCCSAFGNRRTTAGPAAANESPGTSGAHTSPVPSSSFHHCARTWSNDAIAIIKSGAEGLRPTTSGANTVAIGSSV
jgi:hypothetical protein